MKRVIKNLEPEVFKQWKNQANNDWQPSYDILQNPEKRALHEALLVEQGYVCCYCGRGISLSDSHIEHFRPQESNEQLALEYENLHASCLRELSPGAPLHCGHAKGNAFIGQLAISPVDENCERRFIYSSRDGAIYSTEEDDEAAAYMIELLKLDINFLRARRAEAVKNVFDDSFVETATDAELMLLARAYRETDNSGRLTDFGHVLSRVAEQLLGRTI